MDGKNHYVVFEKQGFNLGGRQADCTVKAVVDADRDWIRWLKDNRSTWDYQVHGKEGLWLVGQIKSVSSKERNGVGTRDDVLIEVEDARFYLESEVK
jgi:hypothetical protein